MKVFIYVILSVLAFFVLFVLIISIIAASSYGTPKRYSYAHAKKWLLAHNCYGKYDSLKKIDYTIENRSGYILHMRLLPNSLPSNKYVIMVHGVTVNYIYDAKYIDIFHDLGYNVVTFDERRHGQNKPCICTMGLEESKDLIDVINDTYNRYGLNIYLGLHGESMGASTTLLSFRFNPSVKWAVVDCPYSDLGEVSKTQIKKQFHLPVFFATLGGYSAKILYGYNPNKIRPIDEVTTSKIPLLIFDGTEDTLIPPHQSQDIYDVYSGYKEIYYTKGAKHAFSIIVDRDSYSKNISAFIKRCEKVDGQ